MFITPENLATVTLFIMPGFITSWLLSLFIPPKKESWQQTTLKLFTISSVNYALWVVIFSIVATPAYLGQPINQSWVQIALVPFVLPVLFAVFAVFLHTNDRSIIFLRFLGFNPLLNDNSAWNYKFRKISEQKYVIITLDDDTEVAGVFWTESFASVSHEGGGIYLERVCIWEDDKWVLSPGNDGIYIPQERIKRIEFWNASSVDNEEQPNA